MKVYKELLLAVSEEMVSAYVKNLDPDIYKLYQATPGSRFRTRALHQFAFDVNERRLPISWLLGLHAWMQLGRCRERVRLSLSLSLCCQPSVWTVWRVHRDSFISCVTLKQFEQQRRRQLKLGCRFSRLPRALFTYSRKWPLPAAAAGAARPEPAARETLVAAGRQAVRLAFQGVIELWAPLRSSEFINYVAACVKFAYWPTPLVSGLLQILMCVYKSRAIAFQLDAFLSLCSI